MAFSTPYTQQLTLLPVYNTFYAQGGEWQKLP